jgi:hypothetical protein
MSTDWSANPDPLDEETEVFTVPAAKEPLDWAMTVNCLGILAFLVTFTAALLVVPVVVAAYRWAF